jgi:hypothetical protein
MNEKLTLRESIVCRLLLLVARILAKNADEEIRKELANMDSRIYVATV